MEEDWALLLSFFPDDWNDMATENGALKEHWGQPLAVPCQTEERK